jgi:hypothetical protein
MLPGRKARGFCACPQTHPKAGAPVLFAWNPLWFPTMLAALKTERFSSRERVTHNLPAENTRMAAVTRVSRQEGKIAWKQDSTFGCARTVQECIVRGGLNPLRQYRDVVRVLRVYRGRSRPNRKNRTWCLRECTTCRGERNSPRPVSRGLSTDH